MEGKESSQKAEITKILIFVFNLSLKSLKVVYLVKAVKGE